MNLSEYQKKARSSAIYLKVENSRMLYPALGLLGECGEVAEKTKKLIRDDNWDMKPSRIAAIVKELGDCCWYLANICCDTNLDLDMIYEMRGASIVNQVRKLTLPQLIIHMNYHAIMTAKALEHWYYQHKSHISARDQYTEIPQHLSHIIVCVREIANRWNFTLEEVYTSNIQNLTGRKKRGTLHGDGDNR